jgi:protein-S-isoprenylcysteine O-methyltransferase Ste14
MLLSAYRILIDINGDSFILKHLCSTALRMPTSPALPRGVFMGYFLLLLGGYIRITAQRTLGQYFTWEISLKADHKLCTIGPYSVVRHPGYLGLWTVRLAIDIIQSLKGTVLNDCLYPRYPLLVNLFVWQNYLFTAVLFVWMSYRAKWEDDLMKKEFNGVWMKWVEQTPYRIVPYIY